MADDILLHPWTGPMGGVPPLDQVRIEHLEPAILSGLHEVGDVLRHGLGGLHDLGRKISAIRALPSSTNRPTTVTNGGNKEVTDPTITVAFVMNRGVD